MSDRDVRAAIKALSDEQVAKELEIFTAFTNQFPSRFHFLDLEGLRYHSFLKDEAKERGRAKRLTDLKTSMEDLSAKLNLA